MEIIADLIKYTQNHRFEMSLRKTGELGKVFVHKVRHPDYVLHITPMDEQQTEMLITKNKFILKNSPFGEDIEIDNWQSAKIDEAQSAHIIMFIESLITRIYRS